MQKLAGKAYLLPVVLLLLGIVTRFAFIWHPDQVVFDEVHFGRFVTSYLKGQYYFDIHPPLGKLIIAIIPYVFGIESGLSFEAIGRGYTDSTYILLRSVPNLFGALLPPCIYFFVRSVNGSQLAAFFAGLLVVLENALLVQSHFIFVDPMLLFFGFAGLAIYFRSRDRSVSPYLLILPGVLLGCAYSVKWTGSSFLAMALFVCLWDFVARKVSLSVFIRRTSVLFLTSFVIYILVFAVHFSILDKSGTGDEFMSPSFQKTLKGSRFEDDDNIRAKGYVGKFIEMNGVMYISNRNLTAEHRYSSSYYTWPVMKRTIYYWVGQRTDDGRARIYLTGNPFVWWTALAGLIAALVFWKPCFPETKLILYFGWLINFVPFIFIGRVMFLYHYFPALLFSLVITSIFLFDNLMSGQRYRKYLFTALLVLYAAGFIYFSPLTYGFTLTDEQFSSRIWFKSWE